ncbi:L-serine dehydratase 1 [Serratia odorifera]|uniref:L-serine ammonia-lyase n=1 Tax=Serratia odorifera TaxID=618 RepID=A0A3S4DN23_SEROD|nr:L-serine dehydratase 1 [Serratia odorifera]
MISVFDMFKIGIGPSSSHTVGPMKAGKQFVDDLVNKGLMPSITRVAVDVYGSLSLTGKGHHTDIAIILGLAGNMPDTVDIDSIPGFIRDVEQRQRLMLASGMHEVDFPRDGGMVFRSDNLPLHETACKFTPMPVKSRCTAKPITRSAVALSSTKNTSARLTPTKSPYRIHSIPPRNARSLP